MGFLRNLRLWLRPPRVSDPDFGNLLFMHISKHPERSYWECEWKFPNTGINVFIALRGDESGPTEESRQFYLGLPQRFEWVMAECRPRLEGVFKEWLNRSLPTDIFSVLKLSGFELEDPTQHPVHWDVSFETIGDPWLGITVPFVDETSTRAIVDS